MSLFKEWVFCVVDGVNWSLASEDRARKNELEAFKARKRLLAKQRGQEQLQDYHYADEEEAPLVLKDQ